MDFTWQAPVWFVFLTLFLGAGAGLISFTLARYFDGSKIPKRMAGWHSEVERRAVMSIQADLHAAETRAHLVELIGDLPSDFDATVLLAADIGQGYQRAAIYEAERKGLVPTGTFERVYGISITEVQTAAERDELDGTAQAVPPSRGSNKWIGTHLVDGGGDEA
jgi:hypothetical protein